MKSNSLKTQGFVLFDIDGVIRDVTNSYRLSIRDTVYRFSQWNPTIEDIDELKEEGCWNNDWDLSLELIKRSGDRKGNKLDIPSRKELIKVFNDFYFGCDPNKKSHQWDGYINNERLLVDNLFFQKLNNQRISFGFVSGAEEPSARYVLEERLGLKNPPLIAMGDAPEKPDPTGLIRLSQEICNCKLDQNNPPIGYIGDTIADILTVKNAQEKYPKQTFISIAIAPPHLHQESLFLSRISYEENLKSAGADYILKNTYDLIDLCKIIWL